MRHHRTLAAASQADDPRRVAPDPAKGSRGRRVCVWWVPCAGVCVSVVSISRVGFWAGVSHKPDFRVHVVLLLVGFWLMFATNLALV